MRRFIHRFCYQTICYIRRSLRIISAPFLEPPSLTRILSSVIDNPVWPWRTRTDGDLKNIYVCSKLRVWCTLLGRINIINQRIILYFPHFDREKHWTLIRQSVLLFITRLHAPLDMNIQLFHFTCTFARGRKWRLMVNPNFVFGQEEINRQQHAWVQTRPWYLSRTCSSPWTNSKPKRNVKTVK